MFIPLIYVALVTPYRIFLLLPDTPEWAIVEGLLWGAFVVDIIFNFITAYEDEQSEEIVVDPKRIAKRYAKTWMAVDVIASIPFDFIFPAEEGGASSANRLGRLARLPRAIRVLRLLRLLRLLRVARLQGYLSRFEQITDLHPAIARAFAAAFWVLLSLHFMSCLWFFIGTEQQGESWVKEEGLTDADSWTAYLTSMYWIATVVTSTGFGDIVPLSLGERGFTIVVQLLGVAWTGLVVSTMATIFASLDRQHSTIKQHRRQLEYFMRDARLPRKLKQRVLKSFEQTEHDSLRASAQHTSAILDMLAPSVRKAVVLYTNRKLLHMLPPLLREEDEVQAFIVERLVRIHAAQGEFICVEQTFATHMFWLARGRVNLFSDHERVTSYGSGSFFGVADVLFSPLRVASVQAITECELYSLSREDLQMVCSEFEDFGRRMRRVALKRLGRYAEVIGRPLVPAEYLKRMMELGVSVGLTPQEVEQYAEATSVERIMGGNPMLLPSASFRIGANRAGATAGLQLDPRAYLGDMDVKSSRSLVGGQPKHSMPRSSPQLQALAEGELLEGGPEDTIEGGPPEHSRVSRLDSTRPLAGGHSAGANTLPSLPNSVGPDAHNTVQRQGSRILGLPVAAGGAPPLGTRGRRRSFSFGDSPRNGSPRLFNQNAADDIIPVATIRSQSSVQRSSSRGSGSFAAALQQSNNMGSHLVSPLDMAQYQDRQLAQAVMAARTMHANPGGGALAHMGGMQPSALRKALSQGNAAPLSAAASPATPPATPLQRGTAEAFPAESKREAPKRVQQLNAHGLDVRVDSLGSHASGARAVHFEGRDGATSLGSETRSVGSVRARRRRRVRAAARDARGRVPAGRREARGAEDGYRTDSGGSTSSDDSIDYGDMASPKVKKQFDLSGSPDQRPLDPPATASMRGYQLPRRDSSLDAIQPLVAQVSALQSLVSQLAAGQAETNATLQRLLAERADTAPRGAQK